jgi:hypothetical protein
MEGSRRSFAVVSAFPLLASLSMGTLKCAQRRFRLSHLRRSSDRKTAMHRYLSCKISRLLYFRVDDHALRSSQPTVRYIPESRRLMGSEAVVGRPRQLRPPTNLSLAKKRSSPNISQSIKMRGRRVSVFKPVFLG